MTLQKSLLQHLKKGYSALVSVIKTMWTNKTTNLFDIILYIIRHAKINNRKEEDLSESSNKIVLTTSIPQALRGICIIQECINWGIITYFLDQYWVKHYKLQAKYFLHQIKIWEPNQGLRKVATPTNSKQKILALSENENW